VRELIVVLDLEPRQLRHASKRTRFDPAERGVGVDHERAAITQGLHNLEIHTIQPPTNTPQQQEHE
jgi:hypothetical protein